MMDFTHVLCAQRDFIGMLMTLGVQGIVHV